MTEKFVYWRRTASAPDLVLIVDHDEQTANLYGAFQTIAPHAKRISRKALLEKFELYALRGYFWTDTTGNADTIFNGTENFNKATEKYF